MIIPIFLYIFIWKPEYENEINRLKTDSNNFRPVQAFKNRINKLKNDFYNGNGMPIPDSILNDEDYELNIGNHFKIVAYKFSKSGQYHKSMIDAMGNFIDQYQKDFEPKEPKPNKEVPLTEDKNNTITDPDKN